MAQFWAGQNPKIFERGGRLRRSAVGVATFAPALAAKLLVSVSTFGVGAMVATTTFAGIGETQSCNRTTLANSGLSVLCQGAITASQYHSVSNDVGFTIVISSNVTANVSSGDGLILYNSGLAGVSVTQQANGGNISAETAGILLKANSNSGKGISLSLTGDVEGRGGRGIQARATGASQTEGVSLTTQAVTGGRNDGIEAITQAAGQGVTIVANGDVEGKRGRGMELKSYRGGDISVTAGNVKGQENGVFAIRSGSGKFTITSTGSVIADSTSSSAPARAVHLFSYEGDGTDTLTLNNVSGYRGGIYFKTRSGNNIQITVTGTISATKLDGIKINRRYDGTGTTTISVNSISAGGDGIRFNEARGSTTDGGNVSISATGHVHGASRETGDGIFVQKAGKGDVIIKVGQVTGGREGIEVNKYDAGSVDIEVSGAVLGECGATSSTADCTNWDDAGIWVYTDEDTENSKIVVTASGSVTGSDGISVKHEGTGTVLISVAGDVKGDGDDGIDVFNIGGDDVDDKPVVSITAKNVDSSDDAIRVYSDSEGDGGISISVSESGTINAEGYGIYVENEGNGDISVAIGASAKVTSESSVTVGVSNYGTGDISITASAGSEINSFLSESSNGSTIIDGDDAVWIYNAASGGTVSVDISGDIKAVGDGIHVDGLSNEAITVSMNGAISEAGSGANGIYVNARGSGTVSVTVSGNIVGGGKLNSRNLGANTLPAKYGYAINVNGISTGNKKSGTGAVTITINGGTISAANTGGAIKNGAGSSAITINSGATINGKVMLGGGVDTVQVNGATINSGSIFDAGEDAGTDTSEDVITFSGGSTAITGSGFMNWEKFVVSNGGSVKFNGTDTLTVGELMIASGGEISLSDDAVGDTLTLTGNLTGDGKIKLDVNFYNGTSDKLVVTGDLTGTKVLEVNVVIPDNPTVSTFSSVVVATVTGSATANSITFRRRIVQGNAYSISYQGATKSFVLTGQTAVTACAESTTVSGQFTCSGNISTDSALATTGSTALTVVLASSATADISAFILFDMTSQHGISFTQQSGGRTLNGTGSATGIVSAISSGDNPVSVTLTGNGTLAGSGRVIHAESTGTGTVSVVVAGVTAAHGSATGINAVGKGASVAVTASDVNGGQAGIVATNTNSASGTVTISANGTVTSLGTAISATSSGGGLSIKASGAVTGSATAIRAINNGTSSAASIEVMAGAIVAATTSDGIYAMSKGSGSISISAGAVSGSSSAITAKGDAASNVSVNASGIITSSGTGINASSKGGSVSVSTAVAVAATVSGIVAINSMSASAGGITVNASGSITANSGRGIHVENQGSGDISVTASTVTGSGYGIFVESGGTGTISINVASTITSAGKGIFAEGKAHALRVVASGNITGATGGIEAVNTSTGAGAVSITASGSVNGGTQKGIKIENAGSGSTNVEVGAVTGTEALDILNQNGGAVSLTATGAIVSNGSTGHGIKIVTDSEGEDIDITVTASSSVRGQVDGIYVRQQGSGDVNLTTSGAVTGSSSDGIRIRSLGSSADIKAQTINAAEIGIYFSEAVRAADSSGSMTDVSITLMSGGSLTAGSDGIKSRTGPGNVSIIASGTITADGVGIYLLSDGSGNISVTNQTSATISGSKGVYLKKIPAEGQIVEVGTVTLTNNGSISGSTVGIHVDADTPQAVTITGGGSVVGTTREGILAEIEGAGGVSISVGDVTGAREGILVDNDGGGSISISSTGTIMTTGTGFSAVSLTTSGTAVNVTVNEAEGSDFGIYTKNDGDSATTINVNGELTTTGTGAMAGVYAYGGQDVTGLTVNVNTSGSVAGNTHGIHLKNTSTAAHITVDTKGAVTSTGTAILAENDASNRNIMLTISGNVTAGDGNVAIDTETNGGTTTIVLNSGTITAPNGHAIRNNGGVSTVTVNSGTTIASNVNLGGGGDRLILGGGTFNSGTVIDGGAGRDILQFGAGSTDISTASNFTNFEELLIATGATATSDGNAVTLSGYDVVLQGTLSMRDQSAGDTLTISDNFSGGGTLSIDVNFDEGTSDVLVIGGRVSGTTRIDVNQILAGSLVTNQNIRVVTVDGGSGANSNSFTLGGGGSITVDEIAIGLVYNNNAFWLDLSNAGLFNLKTLAAAFPVSVLEGFARAPTLAQRRGDSLDKERNFKKGFWFTPDSGSRDFGTLSSKNSYETTITGYQAGYDIPGAQNEQGGWLYSITTQWRQFDTDIKSIDGTGGIASSGFGVGATATWYGKNGSYMDLQGQYNKVGADFKGGRQGTLREDVKFNSWFASFEFGQRYEIYENVSLVPQGQFTWGQFHGDSVVGRTTAITLQFDDERSIIARLGLGLEYSEDEFHAYLIGDLIHDTLDEWKTLVNGSETIDQLGALSSEIGGGIAYTVSDDADIFMRASYRFSYDSDDREHNSSYVSAGVRWTW